MRTLCLAVVLVLTLASGASAQEPLTSADRAPLRREAGVLVHPTLGFRLRDPSLSERQAVPSEISAGLAGGSPTVHVWAYSRGEDVVRVVLSASNTPWALSRQSIASSVTAFIGLGASLTAQSERRGVSTATLQHQGRTVALRGIQLRDGDRRLALVITVIHSDAALACAVADSLRVPMAERASALSGGEGLSRTAIREVIVASIDGIRACYESRLRARPEIEGRVVVGFLIRADGTVQEANISETTLREPEVELCVANVVETLRFPPRGIGSGLVGVNYPFVFASGG